MDDTYIVLAKITETEGGWYGSEAICYSNYDRLFMDERSADLLVEEMSELYPRIEYRKVKVER